MRYEKQMQGNMTDMAGRKRREGGFTMLELVVVLSILGVLAAVAIPKVTHVRALANTSKIQLDLETIDTAIILYQAERGRYPSKVKGDLDDYIVDAAHLTPPTGDYIVEGKVVEIPDKGYEIDSTTHRAVFDGRTRSAFLDRTSSTGTATVSQ